MLYNVLKLNVVVFKVMNIVEMERLVYCQRVLLVLASFCASCDVNNLIE